MFRLASSLLKNRPRQVHVPSEGRRRGHVMSSPVRERRRPLWCSALHQQRPAKAGGQRPGSRSRSPSAQSGDLRSVCALGSIRTRLREWACFVAVIVFLFSETGGPSLNVSEPSLAPSLGVRLII